MKRPAFLYVSRGSRMLHVWLGSVGLHVWWGSHAHHRGWLGVELERCPHWREPVT